jgi:enolase
VLSSGDLIDRLARIAAEFPVHLIEDGLGEDNDDGWIALTARLGTSVELVGDDNFCTNQPSSPTPSGAALPTRR